MLTNDPAPEMLSPDSKLAILLNDLTIDTLPLACDADAYLSEEVILKAYHSSSSSSAISPVLLYLTANIASRTCR